MLGTHFPLPFYRISLLFTYFSVDDYGGGIIYSVIVNNYPWNRALAKGRITMLAENIHQVQDQKISAIFVTIPPVIECQLDQELSALTDQLDPDHSWGDRQAAAQRLGNLGNLQAVPALLAALPGDPFWMVRCAIIQALEKIGDPYAIPVLMDVAHQDSFQVVRAYANKAIQRLLPAA